ncbi:hypothetical protein D3C74_370290 [compost metagenome]
MQSGVTCSIRPPRGGLNMKVNERTLIKKVFEGIDKNGWTLLYGLGSGRYNGEASGKSMVAPLVEYLRKNGIEVN